jgi:hypothetical protein
MVIRKVSLKKNLIFVDGGSFLSKILLVIKGLRRDVCLRL